MIDIIEVRCQPTLGKIEQVFKDIFKLSRMVGTFPINSDYSGLCKINLSKSVILYLSLTANAMMSLYRIILDASDMVAGRLSKTIFYTSSVSFYWIHLTWLIKNRMLLKEIYEELKDMEYNLWKHGVYWVYKPSWRTKYLCLTAICLSDFLSFMFYERYLRIKEVIGCMIMYYALIVIICQYTTLVNALLSILREIRSIEDNKTVIKLTNELLALCQKVNTLYEPQLLLYIVVIFIIDLFFIYVSILRKELVNLIVGAFWMMSFVSPLVQLLVRVAAFSQEVKITNKMLYRRLLKNLEDETLQFHLLAKRDLVFTAAGFFILENTLICTMVTTGIDYLIFFLQYM
ncbi:Gustatory receptor 114c [Halyomorpha halys]|nr:Gustatory receptor 114c [Halyomorpha halys]